MKLQLVFDKSGDSISFDVKYNHDLILQYVASSNKNQTNIYETSKDFYLTCDKYASHLDDIIRKNNVFLEQMGIEKFSENSDIFEYISHQYLNKEHCRWVKYHTYEVSLHDLTDSYVISELKKQLPDEMNKLPLSSLLSKIGYFSQFDNINKIIHQVEAFFRKNIEFKSKKMWESLLDTRNIKLQSNNDVTNFNLGYNYLGRPSYDKWVNRDDNVEYDDLYSYEKINWMFQVNLSRYQSRPFSQQFLSWCKKREILPFTAEIPVGIFSESNGNIEKIKKILYNNSKYMNNCFLILEE